MVSFHPGSTARLRTTTVTVQRILRCCVPRRTTIVPFSQDEAIERGLAQLGDVGVVGTEEEEPLACVRTALWGVLYANDAGIVSKSATGLPKMTIVIVSIFEEAGLTVSGNKAETMLPRTPDQTTS